MGGGCLQVVSALVGEIVLCTKEVNKKTRAAAFALLVDLARAVHEAVPLPAGASMATGMPHPLWSVWLHVNAPLLSLRYQTEVASCGC